MKMTVMLSKEGLENVHGCNFLQSFFLFELKLCMLVIFAPQQVFFSFFLGVVPI
jgi:hypothetical protein